VKEEQGPWRDGDVGQVSAILKKMMATVKVSLPQPLRKTSQLFQKYCLPNTHKMNKIFHIKMH
jgi:hypothetical protein